MFTRVPWIARIFLNKCVFRRKTKEKLVYLTFDDGPTSGVTSQLLNVLDEFGWKATFFCKGENVQKHPEIYEDIISRGHKAGNHSYSHVSGFSTPVDKYIENVNKASEYIHSNLFRPPFGRIRPRQRKALIKQYNIIFWDLMTGDFNKSLSSDMIMKKIKRYTRKGSIVVFHDTLKARNNLLAVLPRAIEYWNEQGYQYALL